MKTRKRIASILLAAVMLISGIPSMVFAEGETAAAGTPEFNVQGSKKADPTKLKADRKTTVTLEMPSGEYQNKVDIVFVMDNSTSIKNSGFDFTENVESLFNSILENNQGIDLKVSVIKFRGYATDMLGNGLVKYEGNEQAVINAIRDNNVPGSGSNAHSGLVMAEKVLSSDSEVEDSNKYVVFLTDGKNYMWNNANDEPVTYYMQYAEKITVKNNGKPTLNQKAGIYNKEQGKGYCTVPQIPDRETVNFVDENYRADGTTSAYYTRLFNSDNSELSSTDTKYDFPAYYSKYYPSDSYTGNVTVGDGTATKRTLTNGAGIFNINGQQSFRDFYDYVPEEGTFWENVNYLQLNPYEVVQNEDGTYSYDETKVNEDFFLWHPDAFQKGTYQAGHFWKDTIVEKYNAASVSYSPKSGGGTNLADSFHHWLLETSDYGADITNSDSVIALFDDIDNSIRYMVGSGVVTDEIADDFELDESSATPFRMTYDGTALSAASAGDNKWNFGTANEDGVFPYVVEYDQSTKTITWTINVPIENLKKITLSYDLILKADAAAGTHDTNKSAVLVYTSTDGKYQDQEYEFEKPKVEYNKYKVTYRYTGSVPSGAPAVPAEKEYAEGSAVTKASVPSLSGYTFSGWNGEVSTMPGHDVVVTGSWTAITNDDTPTGGGNPPDNPGGGPTVTPTDPATPEVVPDEPAPAAEPAVIPDEPAPLAGGAWALVNLISAILTSLGAIIALFRKKEEEDEEEDEQDNMYREEDEEDNRGKKMLAAKIAGVLAGVAAPITFFLTEDMSLPMVLIDKWTVLMVAILAVQIVAAVFNKKASKLDDDAETAEDAAN